MIGGVYLCEVVIAAGDQKPLRSIATPPKEWGDAATHRVAPAHDQDDEGHSRCYLCPREALDNDIVPIIANDHHSHDGAGAADGTNSAINLTA